MVISTGPAEAAGTIAVSEPSELTVNDAAGVAPKNTPVAPENPIPKIETDSPPVVKALAALSPVIVGGRAAKVNWSAGDAAELPAVDVTMTSTVAAAWAAATATIVVGESTRNLRAGTARTRRR